MGLTIQDYLAIGFTVGLTIIYVPQYIKIIRMKSSLGFHPWYLFLGYMPSTISCINAVIFYWDNLLSSLDWTPYIQSISGFILLVFQWWLFLIFYLCFLHYFQVEKQINLTSDEILDPEQIDNFFGDEADLEPDDAFKRSKVPLIHQAQPIEVPLIYRSNTLKDKIKNRFIAIFGMKSKKANVILFILSQIIGVALLIITIVLVRFGYKSAIYIWSSFLEINTLIMFCSHYVPQIWETYRLKHVGSLSLITLSMMCPGTFVWTYFLANQSESNLSIWLPYLTVGIMQAVLLAIGIFYDIKKRIRRPQLET